VQNTYAFLHHLPQFRFLLIKAIIMPKSKIGAMQLLLSIKKVKISMGLCRLILLLIGVMPSRFYVFQDVKGPFADKKCQQMAL
jgi:hypothetical protein